MAQIGMPLLHLEYDYEARVGHLKVDWEHGNALGLDVDACVALMMSLDPLVRSFDVWLAPSILGRFFFKRDGVWCERGLAEVKGEAKASPIS